MRPDCHLHAEPAPIGWRLALLRFGTVMGALGWVAVGITVVVAPILAAIYHATH